MTYLEISKMETSQIINIIEQLQKENEKLKEKLEIVELAAGVNADDYNQLKEVIKDCFIHDEISDVVTGTKWIGNKHEELIKLILEEKEQT